jgi:chromosome segregation ATPase
MVTIEEIRQAFEHLPDRDNKTAYELTMKACDLFTTHGVKLPGWNEIRTVIGKGSANDINRAKKDYYQEQASRLRKQAELPGLPPELVPVVAQLWDLALAAAAHTFDGRVNEWENLVKQAAENAQDCDERCELAIKQLGNYQTQLEDQKRINTLLSEQLEETKRSHNSEVKRLVASLEESRKNQQQAYEREEKIRQDYAELEEKNSSQIDELEVQIASIRNDSNDATRAFELASTKLNECQAALKTESAIANKLRARVTNLEASREELIASGLQKDKTIEEKDSRNNQLITQLEEAREHARQHEITLSTAINENKSKATTIDSMSKNLKKSEQQISKLMALIPKQKNSQKSSKAGESA